MTDYDSMFRLAGLKAAERTKGRPDLFDDARQEAMIAGWQASEAHPDKPAQYVSAAMTHGAMSLLRGRSPFGAPSRQGRQQVEAQEPLTSPEGDAIPVVDPRATADLEAPEIASHVASAVRELDALDREMVFRRYWLDQGWAQVAEEMAAESPRYGGRRMSARALNTRWSTKTKPALAESLAHLQHAA